MTADSPNAELSHIVDLAGLSDEPLEFAFEATAEQCAALCKRLDLLDLSSLSARGRIVASDPEHALADVNFRAVVVQSCVVSLEPIPATVEESFTQEFTYATATADGASVDDSDVWVDPGDEPEVLTDDLLDVGELVTQHLSLALDPYPRKPDASFDGYRTDDEPTNAAFAALGALKFGAARKGSE